MARLPAIETAAEALIRTKQEVALRTLCLLLVAAKGEGLGQDIVENVLDFHELRPHLTLKESAFMFDQSPSERNLIPFIWRHEAAWTLLWTLGFVEHLCRPDTGYATWNSRRARRPKGQPLNSSQTPGFAPSLTFSIRPI
jgi:hypothetical protein